MKKEEKVVQEVWANAEIKGFKFKYRIVPQHVILNIEGKEIPFNNYAEMEGYIIAHLKI